jgi:hypothetical protein
MKKLSEIYPNDPEYVAFLRKACKIFKVKALYHVDKDTDYHYTFNQKGGKPNAKARDNRSSS